MLENFAVVFNFFFSSGKTKIVNYFREEVVQMLSKHTKGFGYITAIYTFFKRRIKF